jgi:Zn-dependent peptidase ImmA (M78 family)
VWLLENNGAVVVRDEFGTDDIDAFSQWRGDNSVPPFIILGLDKGCAARSRYDVTHELGHVVLHHKVDRARLEVKSEHRLLEQQAHWFAGAFLLPAAGWAREAYALSLDGFA